MHFVGSADDIAASSDDEDDDEDYDPDNDEYWKKVGWMLVGVAENMTHAERVLTVCAWLLYCRIYTSYLIVHKEKYFSS